MKSFINNSNALVIALAALALAILAIHAWHYMPFIADDALISLRYSQRLIQGHGLTWNPGERVEGYSNLLWVLGCAGLGLVHIDLILASRLLGFLGMSAAVGAVLYAHPPKTLRTAVVIFLALIFLPLSAPIAVWAIGGMEQPLVAGLLAWAVVLCYPLVESTKKRERSPLLPGLLLALLCLTRLDGALFTAATVAVILILRRGKRIAWWKALMLAALPVLFTLLQIAFRRAYYGEWVPNTALVKFAPSLKHALDGWHYIRSGAFPIFPLLLAAAGSVFVSLRHDFMRARMFLLCVLLLSWTAYLVLIGGDIFPAWRHFVPLIVLLVLITAIGAEWIATNFAKRHLVVATTTLVLMLGVFVLLQSRDSENFRAISERWEWDGEAIGLLFKKAFKDREPLMAVDPAGCLPYWSELKTIDMLGLNDYYLPRHPPPGVGEGPIGHELGDGQYVLNRQPDLVVFLLPTGNDRGYFLTGRQMQEDPRFLREYTLVRFEAREPRTVVSRTWVRRYSERIGIHQSDNEISIPAFLLNDNPSTTAYINSNNELVTSASRATPARIANLDVPPGRWRIELEGQTSSSRMRVFKSVATLNHEPPPEAGRMLLDAQTGTIIDLRAGNPSAITIEVVPDNGNAFEVRQLKLTRVVD